MDFSTIVSPNGRELVEDGPFAFRSVVEADLPVLYDIDKRTWSAQSSPGSRSADFEAYRAHWTPGEQWLVELDGTIAGYISLYAPTPLETNAHVLELNIAVHPDYQNRGVGSKLLDYAAWQARLEGKHKLCLRVLASNEGALRFYRRNGFLEQGRLIKEFFINGQWVDDYLLYKWLQ